MMIEVQGRNNKVVELKKIRITKNLNFSFLHFVPGCTVTEPIDKLGIC